MGLYLIYWTPMSGSYFLYGSILEKCGIFWKNGRFSEQILPDWGNTTWADMVGLGSIGLKTASPKPPLQIKSKCFRGRCKDRIGSP